jgi:hypothetical protein
MCVEIIYTVRLSLHSYALILDHLVTDDSALCHTAIERGSLEKLANLIRSITPLENSEEWDEDESDTVSSLREVSIPLAIHQYTDSETKDRQC